jgi:ATP-dependent Clp protease ATP-binding subunit ClpA
MTLIPKSPFRFDAMTPGNTSPLQEIGYTPRLHAALRRADDAHRAAGAAQIGTEHLLFSLADDGAGQSAVLLAYMGVDLAGLRERLVGFRELPPEPPPD